MQVIVDWISISLPLSNVFSFSDDGAITRSTDTLDTRLRKLSRYLLQFKDIEQKNGRAPFRYSLHSKEGGWSYFYGGGYDYSLLELTGTGCHRLGRNGSLKSLLAEWADRLTRLDIACDIETTTDPSIFAKERVEGRFKSGADMMSDTGRTVYVGSRSSSRYARVYRYNPPHPRSHLLRVEHVLKDDAAKLTAAAIIDSSLDAVAAKLGTVFGWLHADWKPEAPATDLELRAPREHHEGSTERWLLVQVLPAIVKLIEEGKTSSLTYFMEQVNIALSQGKRKD